MSVLEAIILGIIQGLAEFLPISSSGHLVLFQKLFNIEGPTMFFDIILHLGTLIPVFIIYRKTIWELIKNPFQKMTLLIIVATIPAFIVALLFGKTIDSIFESGKYLGFCFLLTGVFLLVADNFKKCFKKEDNITIADAIVVGCMQAIGIPPGVSRSGSTIVGACARNIDRETAAKFSFLISIPAILGSALLEIRKILTGKVPLGDINFVGTFFGFIAALLSGYLAITFMIKLIKEAKLKYFSIYVFILGSLVLIDQFITHIFL